MKIRPLSWAADGLFPHFCVGCGREGSAICPACRTEARARMTGFFVCPGCATPTPWGGQCGLRACRHRSSLDGLISAAPYAERRFRELLHLYKYEGVDEAGKALAELFRGFINGLKGALDGFGPATVIGLPLHPFRLALRGFNQSAVLGRVLAAEIGQPYVSGLVKRRFLWRRQVQMKDENRRRAHAERSFIVPRTVAMPESVFLVDDVYTTGATLNACAEALKRAGAERVWGFTLLRG